MKIGIIGLGFMGAAHIGAFAKLPGVEIAAVCGKDSKTLAGDFSDTGGNLDLPPAKYDFSNVHKYAEWRDLLADADVQAVDICLPTDLHADVTVAALQAGKHVLCEKPMALTLADCARMMEAADAAKRVLMVGQVLRFWPEYLALQDFVKQGKYGAVRSATFLRKTGQPDWSKWLPIEARSGGAVMDLLIHDIDQALVLFGVPERVAAKKLGDGDALTATLLYPSGRDARGPEVRIMGGWFARGTPFAMSFQVRADQALLELTNDGLMLSDMKGQRTKMELPAGDAYEAEVTYFVECARAAKQPELCPPDESAMAVKVALALKESRAKDGEQIRCLD